MHINVLDCNTVNTYLNYLGHRHKKLVFFSGEITKREGGKTSFEKNSVTFLIHCWADNLTRRGNSPPLVKKELV